VRAGNAEGWGPFSAVRAFTPDYTGVREEEGVPREIALKQNFPNPFNPATLIEFSVTAEGPVLLEVFNLLGERVATLVDEVRPAGQYREAFNASRLTSGVYVYSLHTGGVALHRKMVLVK
jgi:hypothetical protein